MEAKITFSMKQARYYSGKTQAEMAECLGICRNTYIRWEDKPERVPAEKGKAFARCVGIPIEYISFA